MYLNQAIESELINRKICYPFVKSCKVKKLVADEINDLYFGSENGTTIFKHKGTVVHGRILGPNISNLSNLNLFTSSTNLSNISALQKTISNPNIDKDFVHTDSSLKLSTSIFIKIPPVLGNRSIKVDNKNTFFCVDDDHEIFHNEQTPLEITWRNLNYIKLDGEIKKLKESSLQKIYETIKQTLDLVVDFDKYDMEKICLSFFVLSYDSFANLISACLNTLYLLLKSRRISLISDFAACNLYIVKNRQYQKDECELYYNLSNSEKKFLIENNDEITHLEVCCMVSKKEFTYFSCVGKLWDCLSSNEIKSSFIDTITKLCGEMSASTNFF